VSRGEAVDDERASEEIAWSPPDEPTGTCGVCGADLADKPAEWKRVTPGGAWCRHHVRG